MTGRFDLSGHRALVTGASRGIGQAIALALAEQGADICVHYHREADRAHDVVAAIQALGRAACAVQGDFAKPGTAHRVLAACAAGLGAPDILIANAAMEVREPFGAITWDAARSQFDTNLMGALDLIQAAVPTMTDRQWGRIVLIGSVQQAVANPSLIVYGALKSALENMCRNLAIQFAGSGITVNTVAPGAILTDMNREVLNDAAYRARIVARIPAGRIGAVQDVVGPVAMLCSEDARYVTGTSLFVDGGMHLK